MKKPAAQKKPSAPQPKGATNQGSMNKIGMSNASLQPVKASPLASPRKEEEAPSTLNIKEVEPGEVNEIPVGTSDQNVRSKTQQRLSLELLSSLEEKFSGVKASLDRPFAAFFQETVARLSEKNRSDLVELRRKDNEKAMQISEQAFLIQELLHRSESLRAEQKKLSKYNSLQKEAQQQLRDQLEEMEFLEQNRAKQLKFFREKNAELEKELTLYRHAIANLKEVRDALNSKTFTDRNSENKSNFRPNLSQTKAISKRDHEPRVRIHDYYNDFWNSTNFY